MAGSKMPMWKARSRSNQRQRDSHHRSAEHLDQGSGVVGPNEQRQTAPGHARRAHLVHGDDEIETGENRRKARDEYAHRGGDDEGVRIGGAERRVEGPAGVHAAHDDGGQREERAHDVDVPTQQINAREGQILGADHHWHKEIAEGGRNRRDQEKEDHHHAVHGEELVVGVGIHQVALRGQQFQANQHGEDAAQGEHHGDGDQVEYGDAFVVLGEKPRLPAVLGVQIIRCFDSLRIL